MAEDVDITVTIEKDIPTLIASRPSYEGGSEEGGTVRVQLRDEHVAVPCLVPIVASPYCREPVAIFVSRHVHVATPRYVLNATSGSITKVRDASYGPIRKTTASTPDS